MRQTYPQRILSFLVNNETASEPAVFNRKVAERRFRGVRSIDGVVMRTARRMRAHNILRRINVGQYTLTAKGRKAASN